MTRRLIEYQDKRGARTAAGCGLVALGCAALLASAQARGEATVVFLRGDVRQDGAPVAQGQRVPTGATVATGSGAQVYLQFADRQKIVLDQDSALRIIEYHYSAHVPRSDRATFDLLYGAARYISGVIGARSPRLVRLRTPHATFSLRGTDFIVALPNWAYLKVLKGGVSVTNAGGTVIVGENTAAVVASFSAIATPVFVASLPPAASGPISTLARLSTEPVTHGAAGAVGAAAGAPPGPGFDARTVIKIGIYAALIGAALRGTDAAARH